MIISEHLRIFYVSWIMCTTLRLASIFLHLVTFFSHIFMLQTILQLVEKQSIPHKYVFQTSLHVNRNRFETYIECFYVQPRETLISGHSGTLTDAGSH